MKFKKGKPRPKGAGRKKGTKNKLPIAAKLAMLDAFAQLGGTGALVEWARKNKTEFYRLWSKTLPREISGPDGGPIPFADMTDDAIAAEIARLRKITSPDSGTGTGEAAGSGDLREVAS